MLNYITLKLPRDPRSQPLQDVNDNATGKLVKSCVSIINDNGKAKGIFIFAMTIHKKMTHLVVDQQVIDVYGEIILKKFVLE